MAMMLLQSALWTEPFPHDLFQKSTLSLVLQDRDGAFLFEKPSPNGRFGNWLPQGRIPRHVRITTLAAEDHRLYEHPGVDIKAIARAVWGNWVQGFRRSGASTLAMQLVRQLHPRPRTYRSKVIEMYWALVLQLHLKPEGVLREYLNRAPYGNRVQGIHRASLLYFDRPAADLSLGQAAFLAALPWGPSYLNPFHKSGRRRAWSRAVRILQRARQLGMISRQEYKEALQDPIKIESKPQRSLSSIHFTQRIQHNWRQRGKRRPEQRITTLRTTLDLHLQKKAQAILRKKLREARSFGAGTGAVVVVDHRTGDILSYVGSHSYFSKKEHGAIDYIQVKQSPGSTLKPFVYAHAMQRLGYTGSTLIADVATGFLWRHGSYNPQNDDSRFLGPLRLRVALGNSRNIPALKALAAVGVSRTIRWLRGLGFRSLNRDAEHYGLSLAIGSAEVRLMELVRAYAILARGGKPLTLRWALAARDSLGRPRNPSRLLPHLFGQPLPEESTSLKPQIARVMAEMLSDPMARIPSFSRYNSLEYRYPVAVKTGSSQGYRNAWTIAFSDRVVVGCWIGSHDRRSMVGISGTKGCGPVVKAVIQEAMKRVEPHRPPQTFPKPEGWTQQHVCPLSGQPAGEHCPGTVEEWFPPDHKHKPTKCPFHQRLRVDRRNGLLAGPHCPLPHVARLPFVLVPPRYSTWAAALRMPQAPTSYSPLCPSQGSKRIASTLQIRTPLNNARYLVDPTVPKAFSTIALQAETQQPLQQIVWFRNGEPVGQTPWPYTMRWALERGTHRFVAASPDGQFRSRPVVIHVK